VKQEKKSDLIASDFDDWAEEYEQILNSCLGLDDETDDYFHLQKLACLKRWIPGIGRTATILDFGCGIGKLATLTAQAFPLSTVYGYEISSKCIEVARKKWGHLQNLTFSNELPPIRYFDIIIAANVFHHIKPSDRAGKLLQLKEMIKPGGNIAVFEHNPFNPLTRHIVRTCLFDREAELISLRKFVGLARKSRLRIRLNRYIVFFPRSLSSFQRLEPFLGLLPLGAQYMLLLGSDEQDE
jgi:2-polyprenyl-3-methyl-5-hydroxy-6-metoxy-1,4-benzoquinol methylase